MSKPGLCLIITGKLPRSANFSVDPKHERYSLTNNPLGNTWRIHQNKIITVGNESNTEVGEVDADSNVEVIEAPSLIAKDSESEQTRSA